MMKLNEEHRIVSVEIDAGSDSGALELWRHSLGHGGINSRPLPERVIDGAKKLQPRLIRIFLQEFLAVYPESGRFDWSRADAYLESFHRTGASVIAAIAIKPKPLYPRIDATVWRPSDIEEWKQVIRALVRRYSVEKRIVTHWEIGNETDIGEDGGCPYLIRDPEAYGEYFDMTAEAIRDAAPDAKIGGPANASLLNEPLPGFVKRCEERGTPLDFLTWHLYSSDPKAHAALIEQAKARVADFPGETPELMVTEFNASFPAVSVEDDAFHPRRAAALFAILVAMIDAGLDASFYYHLWDQVCYAEEFAPFFSDNGVKNMLRHWNEIPHRFGLFGASGKVRPQYFVYAMLSGLGERRLAVESDDDGLILLAGRSERQVAVMAANYRFEKPEDRVLTLRFRSLKPGCKILTVERIDDERRWSEDALELKPIEHRVIDTRSEYECQIWLPADCVALVQLREA